MEQDFKTWLAENYANDADLRADLIEAGAQSAFTATTIKTALADVAMAKLQSAARVTALEQALRAAYETLPAAGNYPPIETVPFGVVAAAMHAAGQAQLAEVRRLLGADRFPADTGGVRAGAARVPANGR